MNPQCKIARHFANTDERWKTEQRDDKYSVGGYDFSIMVSTITAEFIPLNHVKLSLKNIILRISGKLGTVILRFGDSILSLSCSS